MEQKFTNLNKLNASAKSHSKDKAMETEYNLRRKREETDLDQIENAIKKPNFTVMLDTLHGPITAKFYSRNDSKFTPYLK